MKMWTIHDPNGCSTQVYCETLDDALTEARSRGYKIKYVEDSDHSVVYGSKN